MKLQVLVLVTTRAPTTATTVVALANGGQEGVVFDRQQNWIYCKTLKESILTLRYIYKLHWQERKAGNSLHSKLYGYSLIL